MDEYGEVRVIMDDLPCSVRAVCYHDNDGKDYIILNARMSYSIQQSAYKHEMEHIKRGDMYNANYKEY